VNENGSPVCSTVSIQFFPQTEKPLRRVLIRETRLLFSSEYLLPLTDSVRILPIKFENFGGRTSFRYLCRGLTTRRTTKFFAALRPTNGGRRGDFTYEENIHVSLRNSFRFERAKKSPNHPRSSSKSSAHAARSVYSASLACRAATAKLNDAPRSFFRSSPFTDLMKQSFRKQSPSQSPSEANLRNVSRRKVLVSNSDDVERQRRSSAKYAKRFIGNASHSTRF